MLILAGWAFKIERNKIKLKSISLIITVKRQKPTSTDKDMDTQIGQKQTYQEYYDRISQKLSSKRDWFDFLQQSL